MRTYSQPISQRAAAEIYTRVYDGMPSALKESLINKLDNVNQVKFMRDFNRIMNLKLRVFAPNMFQIIYEN